MKDGRRRTPSAAARERRELIEGLGREAGLSPAEAEVYIELVEGGLLAAETRSKEAEKLLRGGFAIVSGDGKRVIPVHPRLGIANQYRTWREAMVREINERRMRVDRLILQLIPIYEAAMEKRMRSEESGRDV